MANTFFPFGLQPVRRVDGASWDLQLTTVLIASNNAHSFFRGDLISVLSTGYIDRLASITTGQTGVGVFWGCKFVPGSSGTPYSTTYVGAGTPTTDTLAYIIMDPSVVFRCQSGTGAAPGSATTPVTLANVWQNVQFINGTGNTSTGMSGGYADTANIATTSTYPLTIIGLVGQTNTTASASAGALVGPPLGTNGTDLATAGNYIEVILNASPLKAGATGV